MKSEKSLFLKAVQWTGNTLKAHCGYGGASRVIRNSSICPRFHWKGTSTSLLCHQNFHTGVESCTALEFRAAFLYLYRTIVWNISFGWVPQFDSYVIHQSPMTSSPYRYFSFKNKLNYSVIFNKIWLVSAEDNICLSHEYFWFQRESTIHFKDSWNVKHFQKLLTRK